MRFDLQPQQRPEQGMRILSIEEVISLLEFQGGDRPLLEHYFSPTKKDAFIKDFLHYLNTLLLDARHGNLDWDRYLVLVLTFQFTAPLLEIPAEKEFGLFYRILQKNYGVEEIDLNLHFINQDDEAVLDEDKVLKKYREELKETYAGSREIKENVQKRVKKDAIDAIMAWQHENSLPRLATAFGRSVVIPVFFSCSNRKLIEFYRQTTGGVTYKVEVPDEIL
jgi:hypothetical protein